MSDHRRDGPRTKKEREKEGERGHVRHEPTTEGRGGRRRRHLAARVAREREKEGGEDGNQCFSPKL